MRAAGHTVVAALLAAVIGTAMAAAGALGFSASVTPGLVRHLEQRHGSGVAGRIEGWKSFVRGATTVTAEARDEVKATLGQVNEFYNRVPAQTDLRLWGVEDYWATPAEVFAINGADCEDYALSKFFSLKELGLQTGRLRLVYARQQGTSEAHMVLAYYPDPRADPLILDNLTGQIVPASARPELTPVYMFNDEDLLYFQLGTTVRVDLGQHRKWKDYLGKLARELTY